jgi:hypothetical protein
MSSGQPRVATVPSSAWDDRATLAAIAVLLAVGVAQAGDLLTFVRMVAVSGIGAEMNPLVAYGHDQAGLPYLVAAKIALVVLVAAVFAIVARRHHRTAALVATVGTVAGLVGAYSNFLAIV